MSIGAEGKTSSPPGDKKIEGDSPSNRGGGRGNSPEPSAELEEEKAQRGEKSEAERPD